MNTIFALTLIVIGQQSSDSGAVAQITATIGPVTVNQRDTDVVRGEESPGLRAGDQISTGASGGASLLLTDGVAVQLGADTSLVVDRDEKVWTFRLDQGHLRVLTAGEIAVVVQTPTAAAELQRGILLVTADTKRSRFWAEQGNAKIRHQKPQARSTRKNRPTIVPVRYQAEDAIEIQAGEEITIPSQGAPQGPVVSNGDGFAIPLAELTFDGAGAIRERSLALATDLVDDEEDDEERRNPPSEIPDQLDDVEAATQVATGSTISLALGSVSGSSASSASGGLFSDAQQDSTNLGFPGNIHLVTAQSNYVLGNVSLAASDNFPVATQFWSIGVGDLPTSQVRTDFVTGTGPTPKAIQIPGTDAYLLQLSQYGMPDFEAGVSSGAVGIAGLVGSSPSSPSIDGATPLSDTRAEISPNATFALGELSVATQDGQPKFSLRRADQDRSIVKDPNGNDDNDKITPNSQVTFTDSKDFKFQANVPSVKTPTALNNAPSYGALNVRVTDDRIRKAAFTTLMAESLYDNARRTGQTRFVVDGKIVDITGYRR